MKHASGFFVFCTLILSGSMQAQSYTVGDTLTVVANSGLRMRTSPGHQAGTIRVLPYGEEVVVTNTFDFNTTNQDNSGWLDGYWIEVSYGNVHGYVLDTYLSALPLPTHENELCDGSVSFSVPLQYYVDHHYPILYDQQGQETSSNVDQCITFHVGGIKVVRTIGKGWYKTDVTFPEARISEVVNLLRSMLIGDEMRDVFEEALKFYQNKQGDVHKVNVDLEAPVFIEQNSDGTISLSMTDLTEG